MFAAGFVKLSWSIIILSAPIALYWFVIRPRLKARFSELYAEVDGFWARLWALTKAFRTWIIGVGGLLFSEVPALLDLMNALDTSSWPPAWQGTIRAITIVGMLATRAYATKPAREGVEGGIAVWTIIMGIVNAVLGAAVGSSLAVLGALFGVSARPSPTSMPTTPRAIKNEGEAGNRLADTTVRGSTESGAQRADVQKSQGAWGPFGLGRIHHRDGVRLSRQ
jgi:hypothetical protein